MVRVWTDCFEEKVLDKHGLLRPGERVQVSVMRALLHGPAINATSYSTLALIYGRMMSILCEYYNFYIPYPTTPQQTITAASDFKGESVDCLVMVTPHALARCRNLKLSMHKFPSEIADDGIRTGLSHA